MKALLILLASSALFAQETLTEQRPFQTKLGTEAVDFLGGILYGHGNGRAQTASGAKLRAGLNRFLSLYGDFGYTRILSEDRNFPTTAKVRGSLMDFGGGIEAHYSGFRVQPYGLVGAGSVRSSGKATVFGETATVSDYRFAYSLGGGVRIFATRHIGFSVEAKTMGLPSLDGRLDRYSLGIFYQQRRGKSEIW
jgi:opacity protein-like surface antigen